MMHQPLLSTAAFIGGNLSEIKTGRELSRIARKGSPTIQALTAHALIRGDTAVSHLQLRQAMTLTGSNWGYTVTALRLTAEEFGQIARGEKTLAEFHNHHPLHSDNWLDGLFREVGIDRWWAVLDRATKPNGFSIFDEAPNAAMNPEA
jgi:hypothetical protein